ncbi:hypothetical protein SmphiM12_148 [Sinorhizobium phage phiM12]|uniref:Uncharacterized protein n=1 Tax=Sinorhizobium phage phiM12 TaxID=1357423 RepID=S5MPM4_9CAUD|nr:hypothetical protein AB690_gp112 [Sinorhizobium phage phiM12]AGR47780.1 hypothetical protein SmphiM12_148 [Sinorhizobium phage phiM12]
MIGCSASSLTEKAHNSRCCLVRCLVCRPWHRQRTAIPMVVSLPWVTALPCMVWVARTCRNWQPAKSFTRRRFWQGTSRAGNRSARRMVPVGKRRNPITTPNIRTTTRTRRNPVTSSNWTTRRDTSASTSIIDPARILK